MMEHHNPMKENRFFDAHTHFVSMGLNQIRPNLSETKSLKEAYEIVQHYIKKSEDKVIIAVDWDESRWDERNYPNRNEMDKIFSFHPVIMRRVCGHIAVANTPALKLIPSDWKFIDYKTGILKEDVVLYLEMIFPPSPATIKKAILMAQEIATKHNVVKIGDITYPEYLEQYYRLDRNGKLNISIDVYIPYNFLPKPLKFQDTHKVKFKGIKLFLDGSIGARTAALEKFHYPDGTQGMLLHSDEELQKIIKFAEENQISVIMHTIGDRAIAQALRVYKNTMKKGNPYGDRIEHFELATDNQIREAVQLGIILSMQPNFVGNWSGKGGLYEKVLGRDYGKNNRFRKILDEGGKIQFGSDCMPFSPEYGITSAVNAPFPEQRITLKEAVKLYSYTTHSASEFFNFYD